MERYIAVDSGKYATKIATYNPETKKVQYNKFRTKISDGDFRDDALEHSTLIMEYDGHVYKVGNGAKNEAEMSTSKASEIHKLSVLTAIAINVSAKEVDEVHVAVGIPVKEWENVEKRAAYKEYILPDGMVEMKLMLTSDTPPVTKKFVIKSKHVYPESKGALYLDETIKDVAGKVGIIDIGNLNINCTTWTGQDLDGEYSLTDELGGNVLMDGLSQELSAAFSRVDTNYVAKVLKQDHENRKLVPNRHNPEVEAASQKMIDEYLLNHVKKIKRKCDLKNWSLDFMKIVFIGGTSSLLENEIKTVFGEEVYIPEHPEYVNVMGFLRILCAKHLDTFIHLKNEDETEETKQVNETEDIKKDKAS